MNDLFKTLQTFFTPTQFYCWQTAIVLCILGWAAALNTQDTVQTLLINCGWIFLIIGVGWMTSVNPIQAWGLSLSPWITGGLVCIFLFVNDLESGVPNIAFITWPVVSATIAIFPHTFNPESGFSLPPVKVRTHLLIVFLGNLLLMCWILFHFQIQEWLTTYPELRGENFQNSGFVVAIGRPDSNQSRGVQVADLMGEEVILQTLGKPRSEVERWLFDLQNDPSAPNQFRQAVMNRLATTNKRQQTDEQFWQLELVITEPEYQLVLGARWLGPSTSPGKYIVQKACQISFSGQNPSDLARVECAEAKRLTAQG